MKSVKYIIILLAAVLLALPVLSSSPVSAAVGFGISPPVLRESIAPGESKSSIITVISEAGRPPMNIVVQVKGLGQSPDGRFKPLSPDEDQSPYSARTFISSISPSEFRLETASSQEIEVVIDVPGDVGSGSRYAFIHASGRPTAGPGGIVAVIPIPVIVTISGTELSKTGRISDVTISDFTIGERVDVLDITVTLENTGNHHYKARAKAVLKDGEGNKVTASTPLTETSILPGFSRQFDFSMTPRMDLPSGSHIDFEIELEDGTVLYSQRKSLGGPIDWTNWGAILGIGAAVVVGVAAISGRRSIWRGIALGVAWVMRGKRQKGAVVTAVTVVKEETVC